MPDGARRVTVGSDRLARWLEGFAERHGAVTTETGPEVVALTGADGARAWVTVPFPPLQGGLVEHVARPRTVGVLLVRRGGYAAGVFVGRELVASKVDTGYVQGTTKAGGWSQQRFARRRANQAAALFGEAADVAARVLAGPGSPPWTRSSAGVTGRPSRPCSPIRGSPASPPVASGRGSPGRIPG